jgi:pimeloyl-ACP methyl ester carboxylesterase
MSKISIGESEIVYDDVGSGPAILLVHGYPFNRSMWAEQVAALKDDYRVITPDLRGLGESSALKESITTIDGMAEDLATLLDKLEIKRVVLGGLSMGGYVAFAFYRRFFSRVRALVLADTRPQADTEEGKRGREEQAQKILKEGMESIADSFLEKVLTPATLAESPEIKERVREMILTTKPEGAARALRAMAGRREQTDFLPEIIAPTLIIVGSEDKLTPREDAELMHREIGGSRLEVIEGAAHLSNLEQPVEFNRALTSFLDALQP